MLPMYTLKNYPSHLFRSYFLKKTPFSVAENEQPAAYIERKGKLSNVPLYDRSQVMKEQKLFVDSSYIPPGFLTTRVMKELGLQTTSTPVAYFVNGKRDFPFYDCRDQPGGNIRMIRRFEDGLFTKEIIDQYGLSPVAADESPVAAVLHHQHTYFFYERPPFGLPIVRTHASRPAYYATEHEREYFEEETGSSITTHGALYVPDITTTDTLRVEKLYDLREINRYRLKFLMDDTYNPRHHE